ncbi:MAG: DNA cytosine methyltransferase [Candidatus Dadabacteria bacterium]|nr:DNA cytosine methyltransferase [Candidatus Dadabacteria bacterium]MDE0662387.1 DNA cytosine methyltransferase [Candidatus Dadabacteria bacterium]
MSQPVVNNTPTVMSTISAKAFDVFCSIGGLSYGLQKSGITVVAGLDIDATCRYAYEENCQAEFVHSDIRSVSYADISSYFDGAKYRILVGCAPCQPFSTHTSKHRKNNEDFRWNLINEFLRLVTEGMPEVVSMENVPALKSKEVYRKFKSTLRRHGYRIADGIIPCAHFGVPQSRRRLVLLASLLEDICLPGKRVEDPITVRRAIGHLENLAHGEASPTDPMHVCRSLSPINFRRIQASVPGGSWRDWPRELLPACYRKSSGGTYLNVYGRMSWDKPAPTLTTQFHGYGTGRFGHPEQDRALSLREGAILQTFPEDYKFCPLGEKPTFSVIGKHIGNAVPPLLATAIGSSIINHLESVDARL